MEDKYRKLHVDILGIHHLCKSTSTHHITPQLLPVSGSLFAVFNIHPKRSNICIVFGIVYLGLIIGHYEHFSQWKQSFP